MSFEQIQAHVYETLAPLGLEVSALFAGFAVMLYDGGLYITPAGERYLAVQGAD